MSKLPSMQTELRTLRRLYNELRVKEANETRGRRVAESRAADAEREVVEWKKRFDLLLQRTPAVKS